MAPNLFVSFLKETIRMSAFDQYFQNIYGDRWPKIRSALLQEPQQVLYKNPFSENISKRFNDFEIWSPGAWLKKPENPFTPERDEQGLLDAYVLDPASVFVGEAVGVQDGEKVLDMCAAPGGKSLVMSGALKTSGLLVSNDISNDRRLRMKKMLDQYLPESAKARSSVRGFDGIQYGLKTAAQFDRVLLDAPCSGERHFMENASEVDAWKPKKSENLAQRQYALLCAALLAVKPGGIVVYSTCSINPKENDKVIERLLHKKSDQFQIVSLSPPRFAEKTEYGVQFLPDACGFGPMYCCKIQKHESLPSNRT